MADLSAMLLASASAAWLKVPSIYRAQVVESLRERARAERDAQRHEQSDAHESAADLLESL